LPPGASGASGPGKRKRLRTVRFVAAAEGVRVMRPSRQDDYSPPYPAYTSQYPADQSECVFAQVGVQSPRADAGAPRFEEWLRLARASGDGRPQHVELGWQLDAEGFGNHVAMLYWKHAADMQRFWSRPDVAAWLDAPLDSEVGWWREALRAPVSSLDANYSVEQATWGSGRHVLQTLEQFHGYYGSMRDRTPDFLEGRADGQEGRIAFLPEVASRGRRLRVQAPDKVCFIRGAFGWDQALAEEQRAFMEEMFPVYRTGANYLRDHPLETNCISARMIEEVHAGASNFVQSETLAWFLTLKDLERWTHHHPTHAAIYGGVFKLMQKFDFKMRLNLGHEVIVVPEGQALLEYANCHPGTGFLPFFPALPL
jgi:aldoxime dehydratase